MPVLREMAVILILIHVGPDKSRVVQILRLVRYESTGSSPPPPNHGVLPWADRLPLEKGIIVRIQGLISALIAIGALLAANRIWSDEPMPSDDFGIAPVVNFADMPSIVSPSDANPLLQSHDGQAPVAAASSPSNFSRDCDCFVPYWFTGAELTYLFIEAIPGGTLTLSLDDSTTVGTDFAANDHEGVTHATASPRFWIGRQITPQWSIVARHWMLDTFEHSALDTPAGQVNLPNFARIGEISAAKLYNIDIEAMRCFKRGIWELDGTIGARYASYYADARAFATGVFTTGNFINLSYFNSNKFTGTGITSSLTARRPIRNTCASLFVTGRGSHAWGTSDNAAGVAGTVASSPSSPLVGGAVVTRADAEAEMSIGELQFGVQWDRRLKCIRANWFLHTAFEYQVWKIDQPPTGGVGFGGTIGNLTTNSFMSAREGKADLYGISFGTGLAW